MGCPARNRPPDRATRCRRGKLLWRVHISVILRGKATGQGIDRINLPGALVAAHQTMGLLVGALVPKARTVQPKLKSNWSTSSGIPTTLSSGRLLEASRIFSNPRRHPSRRAF
jgi:hypothetical protein